MHDCRNDRIKLLVDLHIHHMRDHCAQNRNIEGMLAHIILFAAQILYEIDFFIQMTVRTDHVRRDHLRLRRALRLNDPCKFIVDRIDIHRLEAFKLYIIFRHRRNRLSRLKNKDTNQSEILYGIDTLRGQFGIPFI